MATTKRKSRILSEMHETARGLHGAGLISKRRMGEFEALCHPDVHEMPPQKIKALREQAHVSQAVFAAVLNTGEHDHECNAAILDPRRAADIFADRSDDIAENIKPHRQANEPHGRSASNLEVTDGQSQDP